MGGCLNFARWWWYGGGGWSQKKSRRRGGRGVGWSKFCQFRSGGSGKKDIGQCLGVGVLLQIYFIAVKMPLLHRVRGKYS